VTRSATPPEPPAAERGQQPALDTKTSARIPEPDPSLSGSAGVPPARFVAVDLKLAGGSAPTTAGLKWLAEKGYRTVLDLRESSEVSPTFVAEVTNRGLRYIALPISLKSIDSDHIKRFNYEIAAADSRPLFFFDTDGSSAGALWYIHRVAIDRVEEQLARREAQELGLANQDYWLAAAEQVAAAAAPPKSAPTSQASRPGADASSKNNAAPLQSGESSVRGNAARDA
jgi:protein tyrosine phosphatase (PTP) superfamily phosphohydrolase (DUF442 family)